MPLLLNSVGRPEPSPEIQRRLRQVHHGLSLKFNDGVAGHWMVTMEWDRNDPRWEAVRTGVNDPASAYDIIGYLPMDCSIEEAPAYIERSLRSWPKESVRSLAGRMSHYNTQAGASQVEEAMHEVMQGNPAEFASKKVTGRRTRHTIKPTE